MPGSRMLTAQISPPACLRAPSLVRNLRLRTRSAARLASFPESFGRTQSPGTMSGYRRSGHLQMGLRRSSAPVWFSHLSGARCRRLSWRRRLHGLRGLGRGPSPSPISRHLQEERTGFSVTTSDLCHISSFGRVPEMSEKMP